MKNPFKKSASPINREPKDCLSDLQFVAKMQRKIDAYEEVLTHLTHYIFNPNCINPYNPAGIKREISDSKYAFRFLLWIKEHQPDVFERFLNDEFGNKSEDNSDNK